MRWWRPRLAVVSLLVGVVATVGVSWFIARYIDKYHSERSHFTLNWAIPERWPGSPPEAWRPPLEMLRERQETQSRSQAVWELDRDLFFSRVTLRVGEVDRYAAYVMVESGFPWAAMRKDEYGGMSIMADPPYWNHDASGVFGGFPIRQRSNDPWGYPAEPPLLPLIPVWPGFALNTLLYGGLIYAATGFVLAAIGWRRLALGLCARCKYPAGTSPMCTECGEPIPRIRGPKA